MENRPASAAPAIPAAAPRRNPAPMRAPENTRNGLRELDTALLEMTDVFQVPRPVRLRWVILPQLYPYIRT